MPDWIWPFITGVSVTCCFAIYIGWQEWRSRIRFPDDRHENGPFSR